MIHKEVDAYARPLNFGVAAVHSPPGRAPRRCDPGGEVAAQQMPYDRKGRRWFANESGLASQRPKRARAPTVVDADQRRGPRSIAVIIVGVTDRFLLESKISRVLEPARDIAIE